jgi:hypothetical protein
MNRILKKKERNYYSFGVAAAAAAAAYMGITPVGRSVGRLFQLADAVGLLYDDARSCIYSSK